MHHIALELPDDLYSQLRAKAACHGLALEQFILTQLQTASPPHPQPDQAQINAVLRSTGLVQSPDPDLITTYVTNPEVPRQGPIQVPGRPLSEVIIEQRTAKR